MLLLQRTTDTQNGRLWNQVLRNSICPYTTKDVQLLGNKMAAIAKKAIGNLKMHAKWHGPRLERQGRNGRDLFLYGLQSAGLRSPHQEPA